MSDGERAQVYAAELAAFDGTDLEHVVGVDVCVAAIEAVVAGDWWPGGPVTARAARSDAGSSSTRCVVGGEGVPEVRLAAPQATIATAAHELAHVLAGVERGHDDVFRRAHLDVVQAMTNTDRLDARGSLHLDQLRDAYAGAGLTVGLRGWPAPPDVGGAIAL